MFVRKEEALKHLGGKLRLVLNIHPAQLGVEQYRVAIMPFESPLTLLEKRHQPGWCGLLRFDHRA